MLATVVATGLYFTWVSESGPGQMDATTQSWRRIPPRRGLQRLYAVLAAVWVAAILSAVFYGQWQPWHKTFDPKDLAELGIVPDPTPQAVDISELKPLPDPRIETWSWALGLAFVPPLVGYAFMFIVTPWVYRGFRPRVPH